MKLSRLGEFGLIARLARQQVKRRETVVGIGDDSAVLELSPEKYLLVTTDTFIEKVHFRSREKSFFDLGYYALAANISDIAAMGGLPTHALVTIGFPSSTSVKTIDDFYRGLNYLAKKHKIDIIGGDTVAAPQGIVISITLLGEVEKKYLLLRSTARVGDLIAVSGAFGGAAAEKFKAQRSKIKVRLREARELTRLGLVTSMIDSSDGLARSVIEICKASKVGAKIYQTKVPIARGASLPQALYGGQEYELVFTLAKNKAGRLSKKFSIVGEIISPAYGIKLIAKDGSAQKIASGGYEHFK
jgi:thiamine-monophosphate kinase